MSESTHRLLIVDDDDSIRTLVARVLERSGFGVVQAVNGADAIEKLAEGSYDGMVLDLMMPQVDGFGVIDHLRDSNPQFLRNVLVLSAYADFNRERIDPACGVLQKPFEISTLIESVRNCVASTQSVTQSPEG